MRDAWKRKKEYRKKGERNHKGGKVLIKFNMQKRREKNTHIYKYIHTYIYIYHCVTSFSANLKKNWETFVKEIYKF